MIYQEDPSAWEIFLEKKHLEFWNSNIFINLLENPLGLIHKFHTRNVQFLWNDIPHSESLWKLINLNI